jgi:protein-tyrosine phosphatase
MKTSAKLSVLFVCMGNICRSPTAEGVFRQRVDAASLSKTILIDSAGTHAYHIGATPDQRSQKFAAQRGYDLSRQRARKVDDRDFEVFDYILAMDHDNLHMLKQECPPQHAHKLALFMHYAKNHDSEVVPDPYYGNGMGFEQVLDFIEDASDGLIAVLKEKLAAR